MSVPDAKVKEYYEILSQNSLKGETYFVKFKNDPNFYLGIPMKRSNFSNDEDTSFTLNVLEPKEKKGVLNRDISDIEFFEKR